MARAVDIYNAIRSYAGLSPTIVCDLHSACTPAKTRAYYCATPGSSLPVIDFDTVKDIFCRNSEGKKSVDALCAAPAANCLCFIELKSWRKLLEYNGTESAVSMQTQKYRSALPAKLVDSMEICRLITGTPNPFTDMKIAFILVSDICDENDAMGQIASDIAALAGSSSHLEDMCNSLSNQLMSDIARQIPDIDTYYWDCRDLDDKIRSV